MNQQPYHRPKLAKAYCDSLEGKGIANSTSGLFLAGPRRVGKSTFLIEDLIPEANTRNWISVYVDLWADKEIDPASLIIEAIKKSIKENKGTFRKLTEKLKPKKVSLLKAIEFDLSKPGLPENMTLVDILKYLLEISGKRVLLIIDEAQHSLTSKSGINAMFSIKSARDQINIGNQFPHLMLTFTGSNRDKLAQLAIKKDQPFFGSEVSSFPLLDKGYTDFYTDIVNTSLSQTNQFSKDSMFEAFKLTGNRPESLRQIVSTVALNNQAGSLADSLQENAELWHQQIWEGFTNEYQKLPILQQAILRILIEKGKTWSPFSEESIRFYEKTTKQSNITTSSIQKAIKSLRDNGFIWQSNRGVYALEDESFSSWLETV